jgi:hypothetical protein
MTVPHLRNRGVKNHPGPAIGNRYKFQAVLLVWTQGGEQEQSF